LIAEVYENAAKQFSVEFNDDFIIIKDMQKKDRFVEMNFNRDSLSTVKNN
jgi:hypothetical protein